MDMAISTMLLAVLCGAFVLAAGSEQPRGCCMTDYEGDFRGQGGLVIPAYKHQIMKMNFQGVLGQDFTNQRMYLNEDVTTKIGNQTFPSRVSFVADFKKGVAYTVLNGKCYKTKLRGTLNACLPGEGFMSSSYFGMKSASSLAFSTYRFRAQTSKPFVIDDEVTMDVTDDCVLFAENVVGKQGYTRVSQGMAYENVTRGIRDPSVFNKPAACNKTPGFDNDKPQIETSLLLLHNEFMVPKLLK